MQARGFVRSLGPLTAVLVTLFPSRVLAQSESPTDAEESGTGTADPPMMRELSGEQDAQAKEHFEAANRLYDLGSFERAAEEFQLAYDLSNRPQLLFNVYLAYRDGQMVEKSAEALRAYLDAMPNAPNRANLEARLSALERTVAEQKARAADDEARGEEEQGATPDPDPLPPPDDGIPVVPVVLTALGGALLVTSAVTGALALSGQGEIEDNCNDSEMCPADYDALEDDKDGVETLALVTDVLWITGAAAAGVGLAWLLFGGNDESPDAAAACVPGSCFASVRGRF